MTSLVVNPSLEVHERGGMVELTLPYDGTQLRAGPALLAAIERLRASAEPSDELSGEALHFLRACNVLVPAEHAASFGRGVLAPAPACVGRRASLSDLQLGRRSEAVAIVGAPFDTTTHYGRSPKTGPDAIRGVWSTAASDRDAYVDLGDAIHHPHDEPLAVAGARLAHVVDGVLRTGALPLVLGGDHSVSYYAARAVTDAVGPIGVLHFDAHHDMTPPPPRRPAVLDHSTVISRLLDDPRIEVVAQLGLRPWLSPAEDRGWGERVKRVRSTDPDDAVCEALRSLPAHLPYYVTIDVDVLDAAVVGQVTTPAVDGWLLPKLVRYLSLALGRLRVVAADIVEVCAAGDARETSAAAACELIRQFAGARWTGGRSP